MLALKPLKGREQRFSFSGRQAALPEAAYERTLVGDVCDTFADMPPDHVQFDFFRAHAGIMARGASGR